MGLSFLFDHNVKRAVAEGMRRRGVDVRTAYEEGLHRHSDETLLEHAAARNLVLFTHDNDFLSLAQARMLAGKDFASIAYVAQNKMGIGQMIDDLAFMAEAGEDSDRKNQVFRLPI